MEYEDLQTELNSAIIAIKEKCIELNESLAKEDQENESPESLIVHRHIYGVTVKINENNLSIRKNALTRVYVEQNFSREVGKTELEKGKPTPEQLERAEKAVRGFGSNNEECLKFSETIFGPINKFIKYDSGFSQLPGNKKPEGLLKWNYEYSLSDPLAASEDLEDREIHLTAWDSVEENQVIYDFSKKPSDFENLRLDLHAAIMAIKHRCIEFDERLVEKDEENKKSRGELNVRRHIYAVTIERDENDLTIQGQTLSKVYLEQSYYRSQVDEQVLEHVPATPEEIQRAEDGVEHFGSSDQRCLIFKETLTGGLNQLVQHDKNHYEELEGILEGLAEWDHKYSLTDRDGESGLLEDRQMYLTAEDNVEEEKILYRFEETSLQNDLSTAILAVKHRSIEFDERTVEQDKLIEEKAEGRIIVNRYLCIVIIKNEDKSIQNETLTRVYMEQAYSRSTDVRIVLGKSTKISAELEERSEKSVWAYREYGKEYSIYTESVSGPITQLIENDKRHFKQLTTILEEYKEWEHEHSLYDSYEKSGLLENREMIFEAWDTIEEVKQIDFKDLQIDLKSAMLAILYRCIEFDDRVEREDTEAKNLGELVISRRIDAVTTKFVNALEDRYMTWTTITIEEDFSRLNPSTPSKRLTHSENVVHELGSNGEESFKYTETLENSSITELQNLDFSHAKFLSDNLRKGFPDWLHDYNVEEYEGKMVVKAWGPISEYHALNRTPEIPYETYEEIRVLKKADEHVHVDFECGRYVDYYDASSRIVLERSSDIEHCDINVRKWPQYYDNYHLQQFIAVLEVPEAPKWEKINEPRSRKHKEPVELAVETNVLHWSAFYKYPWK